jgi:two-component system alkaline phosphatase synthesis response regulator PhoP
MPKKVIVCDDDLYVIEAVSHVAREEGFEVVATENGTEALRLVREHRPDLLLLDVMMGETDGLAVCRDLKSDPGTRQIYVILLTAMGQASDVENGYRAGADEYMTKPFSPRSLRRRLHELLDPHP